MGCSGSTLNESVGPQRQPGSTRIPEPDRVPRTKADAETLVLPYTPELESGGRTSSGSSAGRYERRDSVGPRRSSWKYQRRAPASSIMAEVVVDSRSEKETAVTELVSDPLGESDECFRTMSTVALPMLEEIALPGSTPKVDGVVSPPPQSRTSQRSRRKRALEELEARAELHRCSSAGTRSTEPGPLTLSIAGSIRTLVARVRCTDHEYELEPPISTSRLREVIQRVTSWQRQLDATNVDLQCDVDVSDV